MARGKRERDFACDPYMRGYAAKERYREGVAKQLKAMEALKALNEWRGLHQGQGLITEDNKA